MNISFSFSKQYHLIFWAFTLMLTSASNFLTSHEQLDTSFGTNGNVFTDFNGNSDLSNAITIQYDNKIILAGNTFNGSNTDFGLVRYNADGSLDVDFGNSGKVSTDFGNSYDNINSILVQSDGKIIALGATSNSPSFNYGFALARYNSDGTLDTTFGTNGKIITDFDNLYSDDDFGNSLVIQADNKIIAGGISRGDGVGSAFFVLARYNSDGTLDTSFGTNGKTITNINSEDAFGGMLTLQLDGKIVLAGSGRFFQNNNDFVLMRYNDDGSLDNTFGLDGIIVTDFEGVNGNDDYASSLAIQLDGKIVLAGNTQNDEGGSSFTMARYNNNGSLDTCFDGDGKLNNNFTGGNIYKSLIAIQENSKIIITGNRFDDNTGDYTTLTRLNYSGSLDTSFGDNGFLHTDINQNGEVFERINSILLQPDGKMLLSGYYGFVGSFDFFLSRYQAPQLDNVLRVYCISRLSSPLFSNNPTNADSVDFHIVFSKPVTNVDVTDFKLTTTGVSGASITQVSGSGVFWTVTVNTGSKNGTIRLDLLDDDSILDSAFNPLGGAGVGNGNFSLGEVYTIIKHYPLLPAPRIPPYMFRLISNSASPTLSWTSVNNATAYNIVLASDKNFNNIVSNEIIFDSLFVTPPLPDGKYYWKVYTLNQTLNAGKASIIQTLTIDTTPPAIPTLTSPMDSAELKRSPILRWTRVVGGVIYELQVSTSSDFSSATTYTLRTNSRNLPALPDNIYYWRVRVKDTAGNWSDWSLYRTFEIDR